MVSSARLLVLVPALVCVLSGSARACDMAVPPQSTREVLRAEAERTGASLDANTLFGKLVHRYRGLALYQDSVKIAHRTVARQSADGQAAESHQEQSLDCTVTGSILAVVSSAVGGGGSCDALDASPLAKLELARHLWALPHLSLRFADEPLRSMRGGHGTLVPTAVEEVTIDQKQMLRLHLESAKVEHPDGRAADDSTMDLFVNPRSLLIERVEHSRTIAEGVRYEATLEIKPERAESVPEPTLSPTTPPTPQTASQPASQPATQPAAQPAPPPTPEGGRTPPLLGSV